MQKENYNSWRQIIKLIANIFSWTILALLLIVAAFLVYVAIATSIYASKGEDFEPKFSLYTIISPSMKPNINVYDIIIDTRVDNEKDIKINDVITFISTGSLSQGMTVTHRVVDIITDPKGEIKYKTKGDNNLTPDTSYVSFPNVLGKVLFRIPQLGKVQYFLANKGGWLLIIVIPALYIIIKDIIKLLRLNTIKEKVQKMQNK